MAGAYFGFIEKGRDIRFQNREPNFFVSLKKGARNGKMNMDDGAEDRT
jgi:hypothetical protein